MLNFTQFRRVSLFAILLTVLLLLTGCGSDASMPDTVASPTDTPSVTTATSSVTPDAVATIVTPGAMNTPAAISATVVPPPTAEEEFAEEQEESLAEYDVTAIESLVGDIVGETDGHLAVVLADANGTVLFDLNGSESMEAASLYKVPVMVELFRQFETEQVDRDGVVLISPGFFSEGEDSIGYESSGAYVSIDTLLFEMIAQSSNVAAYALLDLVGNDNVNASMADLGLDGIEIRWSPRHEIPETDVPQEDEYVEEYVEPEYTDEPTMSPEIEPDPQEEIEQPESDEQEVPVDEEAPDVDPQDDPADSGNAQTAEWLSLPAVDIAPTLRADAAYNVVNASNMAQLLVLLLNGDLVSEQASSEMLDLLAQQQIPGGLPALLPDGVVAHKTGYLEDGVFNDAGIISSPSGQMVAVVLTENVREDLVYGLMSGIGLLLYELEAD